MITFTADLCTDCVECSSDGKSVALGCYQLHPDGEKTGAVHIFDKSLGGDYRRVDSDAILDMKWREKSLLLATNSRGLGILTDDLSLAYSTNYSDQVYLSLDYTPEHIYCSTNMGNVNIYDHSLNCVEKLAVHELETWTVCADGQNVIYTGADDCLMKGWDVRSKERLFVNKQHSAGVCSIISLDDTRLASGSYDKELRIWDKRNIRTPLSSLRVESGVWRLKRMADDRILAACMHDGFYVFDCSEMTKVEVIQHEVIPGLAYGCTFNPTGTTAYTCCFYHKQAHEWLIKNQNE